MSQLKILPPTPRIRRSLKIRLLCLLRHTNPLATPHPISPNIIHLRQAINNNIHDTESDQRLVALPVQRGIVLSVDVRDDNPADLDEHVVQGSADCPGPNWVGVAATPADLDGVGGWEGEQDCENGVAGPGRCHCRQSCEGDDVGEDLELGEGTDAGAFVEAF
jgi:hypothetical protein